MRNLDAPTLAALGSTTVQWTVLAELDFASGIQRVWAGPLGTQITWDGQVWTGLGNLGSIDKIGEAQGLSDTRMRLTLRVPGDPLDAFELEDSAGRSMRLIVLLLDANGVPIGSLDSRGTMGAVSVESSLESNETSIEVTERVSVDVLMPTALLERTHVVRMTNEAQHRIDPGDWGLEFSADPEISNLGRVADTRNGGSGGGGGGGRTPPRNTN